MFCENCGQKIEDNVLHSVFHAEQELMVRNINPNQPQPTAQTTPQQVISPNMQQQNSQIINNNIIIGVKLKK